MKKIQSEFSNPKEYRDFIDRLEFADSHKPLSVIRSKFDNQGGTYYLFVFRNNVLAECPQYGNAAYVLKGTTDYKSVFTKSRQELRKNYKDRIVWIRHTTTWKKRLSKYLN